ncbi:hypothetical protein J4Q44_G00140530, partial [Coregonus suidteri]
VESKASALQITDALAGHAHQLQVRARDEINPDSQWSDWSPLLQSWPWSGCTAEPTEQTFSVDYKDKDPSTANTKSDNLEVDGGSLGVVILLALFAVIILALVSSLFALMWVRQWRRDNVTRQELTSMLKMKSCQSGPRLANPLSPYRAPTLHQAIPPPAVCCVQNTLPTTYQETHHTANNPSGVSAWPGRCLPMDRHGGPTD